MTATIFEQTEIENTGDLIQVDRALQSWRDAGYDLCAAAGEAVDNSIEAGARLIRIQMFTSPVENGKRHKQSVDEIVFADNGTGIPIDILPNALTMGYSTRYNKRNGLGRFGVGAKLAALSQARRVDIYTRPAGSDNTYHTFFDLDMIDSGEQKYLHAEVVGNFPVQYATMMQDEDDNAFASGSLVVWSKVDRLEEGGKFGSSVNERKQELIKYLGRTYRKFLQNGTRIVFDGREITLHDPLFLLDNPRAIKLLGEEYRAEVIAASDDKVMIAGHKVEITVTLLPAKVRLQRGDGGVKGLAEPYKELNIPDNEGCISILRHGREIYYNTVPKLLPSGVKDGDRFIGIEIAFPAALDEYFQVRHVKRGAEPVAKLRDDIRRFLVQPVEYARKRIQDQWGETGLKNYQEAPQHSKAVEAYQKMEETAPRGLGGSDIPVQEAERLLEDAAIDLGASTPKQIEEVKEHIRNESLTVIDGDWPGKELFDIQHVNGRVLLKLNLRHPFMRHIYQPVKDLANGKAATMDSTELEQIARRIEGAVDLMLFAYAKAESMHLQPEQQYGKLRGFWGQFLAEGVQKLLQTT